jgi:hypothetical protein
MRFELILAFCAGQCDCRFAILDFQSAMGGSLKAEGFGDGKFRRSHPQAALEAATRVRPVLFMLS